MFERLTAMGTSEGVSKGNRKRKHKGPSPVFNQVGTAHDWVDNMSIMDQVAKAKLEQRRQRYQEKKFEKAMRERRNARKRQDVAVKRMKKASKKGGDKLWNATKDAFREFGFPG